MGERIVHIRDRRPRGFRRDPGGPWQARLRALLDLARDAFVETDGDGVVTEWNRQAELLFGWSRDEVLGRSIDRFLVPTRYMQRLSAELRRAAALSGAGRTSPRQLWLTHREGHEVQVATSAYVVGVGSELRIGSFLEELGEQAATEEALAHAYLHDSLTGLPNRTQFTYRLAYALASSRGTSGAVAVLVLDLDRFKAVNDALGHEVGDELLVALASRLSAVGHRPGPPAPGAPAPEPVLLARLGGDEFLGLFDGEGAEGHALAYAEGVLADLAAPLGVAGKDIYVGASIGVASTDSGTTEPTALLSNADAAMYQAKRRGGNRVEVFGEELRVRVLDRMDTEHALHRALERSELELHYQPVVRVADGRPVGCEALLRWDHPDQGLVSPNRFIPVAEESGLIIPIGAWVLAEGCRQVARWEKMGMAGPAALLEVNLSARQVDHPDLVGSVERALGESGVAPDRVVLEITESTLMHDARSALRVLRRLKDLGVALAIDDFGTGYSSLGYLQQFPLDVLKVDKSFVAGLGHEPGGEEIVAAVVGLAHALGLRVVAEGVETHRQLAALQELGCDFAQGYLFSPPVPAEDLVAWEGGRATAVASAS